MGILKDYYNDDTFNQLSTIGTTGPFNFRPAQSFTASSSYTIGSVKLLLYKNGTPGTITVGIYNVDGSGFPTGAALASGTTNGNTLTTDSDGEWREITFSSSYSLSSGTQYSIVASATGYRAVWVAHNQADGLGYSGGKLAVNTGNPDSWSFANGGRDDAFFETYNNFAAPTDYNTIRRLVAAAADTIWYEDI